MRATLHLRRAHRLGAVLAALAVLLASGCGEEPTPVPAEGTAPPRTAPAGEPADKPADKPAPRPDPLRESQWSLRAAHLPAAWREATGAGTVIAIVDTGVDPTHPDLRGKLTDGYDFVAGRTKMTDPNGHGTHVAGIAAASVDNGAGIAGAAPDAEIMPVRVLDRDGSGSDAVIAEGISWAAEHGADVINLSLGESGLISRISKGGPLNRAIRLAAARGAVVVAAAGNDGALKRSYRASVPVVVVTASDRDGDPASFSNAGDPRSVAAPGEGIVSTAPRKPTVLWPEGTNGYRTLSGTSMAAPLVAGAAALLAGEGLGVSEVIARLSATARPGDPRLGAGIIDAAAAVR